MVCLLADLDECAEDSMCQWWMLFRWPSFNKPVCWFHELCLPGDLNNECAEAFPVLLMELSLWADVLSHRSPEWVCKGFPVSGMNTLYKTIFWAFGIDLMSSVFRETWRNIQRLSIVSNECPLQDHLPSKLIRLIQQAPSPRRSEQWMCRGFWVKLSFQRLYLHET